jgi:Helix-turn-helix domain.
VRDCGAVLGHLPCQRQAETRGQGHAIKHTIGLLSSRLSIGMREEEESGPQSMGSSMTSPESLRQACAAAGQLPHLSQDPRQQQQRFQLPEQWLTIHKVHKVKLCPTKRQRQALRNWAAGYRLSYNRGLNFKKENLK